MRVGWGPARVAALLVKPAPGGPSEAVTVLEALARHGLVGDCHAGPLGPRQVLVARQEDIDDLGVTAGQLGVNAAVAGLAADALRSGTVLRIGAEVRVRLTHACEVCARLRPRVGAEVMGRLPGRRGTLGVVLEGGTVAADAAVVVEPFRYPTIPDAFGERAAWVVAQIPPGRVSTYGEILPLIGGTRAHLRALPAHLRRAERAVCRPTAS